MSHSMLGIDISRSHELVGALNRAAGDGATATALVLEAESLAQLTSGTVGRLDQVGRDCAALGAAINAASTSLVAFRLPPIARSQRRAQAGAGTGHPTAGGPSRRASDATAGRAVAFGEGQAPPTHPLTGASGWNEQPSMPDLGLDHVMTGVGEAAPQLAERLGEHASHQRYLSFIVDDQRVAGPAIRFSPAHFMADTRYWLSWARHDVELRSRSVAAGIRGAGFGGAATASKALGRLSIATGGALSLYTIYQDGRAAYVDSNGDRAETTVAVLRATAGEGIELTAVAAASALCAPSVLGVFACSSATSAAVDGHGVEVVDGYFHAMADVADDMGLRNIADDRSFAERITSVIDWRPWK